MSVIWIYTLAGELVSVLQVHTCTVMLSMCCILYVVLISQTFGAVFSVSDGILGLTFLAWGNSIGGKLGLCILTPTCISIHFITYVDAVSNITMARQGFPRMAVGACFGSPLMSIQITLSEVFHI